VTAGEQSDAFKLYEKLCSEYNINPIPPDDMKTSKARMREAQRELEEMWEAEYGDREEDF